eukprot:5084804-Amphidinium_carterae.2
MRLGRWGQQGACPPDQVEGRTRRAACGGLSPVPTWHGVLFLLHVPGSPPWRGVKETPGLFRGSGHRRRAACTFDRVRTLFRAPDAPCNF